MPKHLAAAILFAIALIHQARADSADDRLKKLHELYQCPIFAYLVAIRHVPTPTRLDNRFLIVTIDHRVDQRFYAQCAFENLDRTLHCEISSPYFNEVMRPYFRGDRLEQVKALGYRARRKDNYFQKRDARSLAALYDAAGLLIDTLGRVFDMAPEEGLIYEAPLVKGQPPDVTEPGSPCAPLISAR